MPLRRSDEEFSQGGNLSFSMLRWTYKSKFLLMQATKGLRMAKIAVLDDYEGHAHIFSAPLSLAGHEVLTEVIPINWERVLDFGPQVISVVLYRQRGAFNRPIVQPTKDILGFEAILEMEKYPAIQIVPIVLVGNAIEESDVPTSISYDLFLTFPNDIDLYLPKLEELANRVKSRRKISGYLCPNCKSRLVFIKQPAIDLFCPRCHTVVSLINDKDCLLAIGGAGPSVPCKVVDLMRPSQNLPAEPTP
jgi:hypothetical protein